MHGATIETIEEGIKLDKPALGHVSQVINNAIVILLQRCWKPMKTIARKCSLTLLNVFKAQ